MMYPCAAEVTLLELTEKIRLRFPLPSTPATLTEGAVWLAPLIPPLPFS
jgi:hypothetical protein